MPKDEQTSPDVASDASKLMRHSDPAVRKVAASALNQAADKKKYVARTGISIERGKSKVRIEAGDPLPSVLSRDEIDGLLAISAIEEK